MAGTSKRRRNVSKSRATKRKTIEQEHIQFFDELRALEKKIKVISTDISTLQQVIASPPPPYAEIDMGLWLPDWAHRAGYLAINVTKWMEVWSNPGEDHAVSVPCVTMYCSSLRLKWAYFCAPHQTMFDNSMLFRRRESRKREPAPTVSGVPVLERRALEAIRQRESQELEIQNKIKELTYAESRRTTVSSHLESLERAIAEKQSIRYVSERVTETRVSFDSMVLIRLLSRQGFNCNHCGVSLEVVKPHIDHVVPLSKGGTNEEANLQLLCARCNLKKGNRFSG